MNDVPLNIRFSIPAKKNIRFSGIFFHDKWMNWVHLFERLMVVQLLDDRDKYVWHLPSLELFFVKSMYRDLKNDHIRFLRKYICYSKVPLMIRIFMWCLHKKVFLIKDNLMRRNWMGSKKCAFFKADETADHLFIKCPFAKII
jgi:hypothetical protein